MLFDGVTESMDSVSSDNGRGKPTLRVSIIRNRLKMATVGSVSVLVVAVLSGSCAPSPHQAGAVRKASLASGECVLHHVPLRTTTMYDMSEAVPSDPEEFSYKLIRRYPNAGSFGYERLKSRYYQKPVRVRICPLCERLFLAGTKQRHASER
jgi:hypothetical protein